jgi:hypothetical protein
MGSSGSTRAQIGTLIIATSGVQLANGFFNTSISLRVAIESFEATMAGLVLNIYVAGFTLAALRCEPIIERVRGLRAPRLSTPGPTAFRDGPSGVGRPHGTGSAGGSGRDTHRPRPIVGSVRPFRRCSPT